MVDLVHSGRNPDDLAREFEPTGHSIRAWVAKADQKEGLTPYEAICKTRKNEPERFTINPTHQKPGLNS